MEEIEQSNEQGKRVKQSPDEVYYRVNVNRLNALLRDEYLVAQACKRINQPASQLMRAVINSQSAKRQGDCRLDVRTEMLPITRIVSALPPNAEFPVVTSTTAATSMTSISGSNQRDKGVNIRHYLEALCADELKLLQKAEESSGGSGSKYMIDYERVIGNCRKEFIEDVIEECHGPNSLRLYRALESKKILDEKALAKLCLLNPKDARERLFKLFKLGLIEMQVRELLCCLY